MIIRICSFTEAGRELAERIKELFRNDIVVIRGDEETDVFVSEAFAIRCPLIFVGACGIAVRKIAPLIKDKLTDPPVIVVDEKGEYVIPILSGHMGGANELAGRVADFLEATAVITTATDVNNTFAVDVFARDNNLGIVNREGIKKVSSKVLNESRLSVSIEGYPPKKEVDVIISGSRLYDDMAKLCLYPKKYFLGIGCRKDISVDIIEEAVRSVLADNSIDENEIANISSIDLKKHEKGLNDFAAGHGLRFITYSAEKLKKVLGEFSASEFVESVTGVDNVCERAALLSAGANGYIVVNKTILDGVTIAIAKRD